MRLEQALEQIVPADQVAQAAAKRRWDSIAKPLGSLGLLEEAIIRIAGITGDSRVCLDQRCVVICCADNGVVAEGVTQTGSEVTAVVTENFCKGETSVAVMAQVAHCDLLPVDLGVARAVQGDGLVVHKLGYGTGNIAREPAMTREQALEGIEFGLNLAGSLCAQGYQILATGEMGIGNTTTSSAVAAVLLGCAPVQVTGRGAGLDSAGLSRKLAAIEQALALHQPDPTDPLDVLAKVGGFDLAGLCGVFLGAAVARRPVLVDGFISAVAALLAVRLCPAAADYLLASHCSKEPAGSRLLEELGIRPMITADMCLGEGTGAVAALPLLDMALAVYNRMSTFAEIAIEAYQPQE